MNADVAHRQDVRMAAPHDADLNRLFEAALEFGSNWRRPVAELAAELFPSQPQDGRDALVAAVELARSTIEAHIEEVHIRLGGQWPSGEEQQAEAWIADRYPWMTKKSRRRARSQGQYYAWHDHG
ncbi:hypothetical protein [Angustibacter luteus]|uniref:Uncharacterized protein n=1 Tax=Angustibacter luteus TaxID=658456 RepID=A0ABW1JCC0_9ACTN